MEWIWQLGILVAACSCASVAEDAPHAASKSPPPAKHSATPVESAPADDPNDVIGKAPPPWNVRGWINSPPLTLEGLRGKVVLARWFMSPSCPFCNASAPVLRELDSRYRARGLVVVGMYHHKDPEPLDDAKVADYAREYGYTFPVAIDPDWRTLHAWWLDGHDRDFTSVSFLLDKQGVIRHVHPGGTIHLHGPDGQALVASIEKLLGAE